MGIRFVKNERTTAEREKKQERTHQERKQARAASAQLADRVSECPEPERESDPTHDQSPD
jgi:hypothetical protein